MLSWAYTLVKARAAFRSAAVALAILFAFAPLAPLAAQSGPMACCRKSKGCCPRSHASTSPTVTARSCAPDCCPLAPAVPPAAAPVLPRTGASSPAIAAVAAIFTSRAVASSRLTSHNLQQRPPPHSA